MYSLRTYGDMIADAARFEAYARAIEATVRPGDAVCEIGSGPGLFSILACRAGARRVFAIESEDIAGTARRIIAANGLSDRIEVIQKDSRGTELPERANLIFSDVRGALPLHGRSIETLRDARQRFLAPGGVMIPRRDVLQAGILRLDEYYSSITRPWMENGRALKLEIPRQMILNSTHVIAAPGDSLLTNVQRLAVVDYLADPPPHVEAHLIFRPVKSGVAHGIGIWFETELYRDIGFSTGPGSPVTIYGQVFLPWLAAVALEEGQEIHVELRALLVGEEYIWRWQTEIMRPNCSETMRFDQSTFAGANLSSHSLRRHATDFVPVLDERGRAEKFLLDAMNGRQSLEGIAETASHKFPKVFSNASDAFERVAHLARRFSR